MPDPLFVGLGCLLICALAGMLAYFVLRYKQVQAQLLQRQKEIDLLTSVGQFTATTLELDDLLWNIYEHVARSSGISVFYIALYDAERGTVAFPLVVHDGERVAWPERKLTEHVTEYVIQLKEPVHLRVSQRDTLAGLRDYLPRIPYQAYLGVPLVVETQVLGVMSVLNTETEDAFSHSDIAALQTVASQVALAVRNAMLFTAESELVQKLSEVNSAVQEILATSSVDNALELACQMALKISGGQKAALYLADEKDKKPYLRTSSGLDDAFMKHVREHPPAIPDSVRVVTDVSETEQTDVRHLCRDGAFRALVDIPMHHPPGMFSVYYDEPHFFRRRELDPLKTLVNHISALLENARLFSVMEHYAYEMSELVQLSRISTSSLDMSKVVHDIADMLQQMTNASRVAIIAVEDERLRQLAAVSNNGSVNGSTTYIDTFSELSELRQAERPATRAFHRSDAGLSPALVEHMTGHQEQAIAMIPLLVNNDLLGVVLLGLREARQFEERDWRFVEMAANQIAAQINNVRLYERTQQELNRRLKQVSIIEKIAQQVSSSLDFNLIIDYVLEAAINATGADLASLGLLTEADQLWVIEHRMDGDHIRKRHFAFSKYDGITGQVLQEGRVINISNNQQTPRYVSDFGDTYNSSLVVPLTKDGEIAGMLNVESTRTGAFNNSHADFLINLSSHAVISIENARFLEERQYEIEMLKSLRELSLWLVGADNTRAAGHEILETALQLLDGQNGVVYGYEPATGELRTLVKIWYSQQVNDDAQVILPDSIARQATQQDRIVVVPDIQRHDLYNASADYNYRSVLAFPLRRTNQIYYCILITFEGTRTLINRDFHTIDLLSSQALGHLENARLHERIRQGRDQMQAILNSTRDGMILLDSSAHVIEANLSASELLGIDFAAYLGKPVADILSQQINTETSEGYTQAAIDALVKTLQQQPHNESRRAFRHRVGNHTRHLEEIGLPVRDDTERIVGRLLVLRDVSEAQLLEEQREDLTDMVIHDLRGPLGGVINALKLALPMLGVPEDQPDVEKLLTGAITSSGRLLGLVNTLLDISKMESPGLKLDCEPVAVPALVETAFMSLSGILPNASIHLRFDLPGDLPLVMVDREKIERVIINLLDNALRYTPSGGEIIISARVADDRQRVILRIQDSGPGIPPDRRDSIFQRFQRIPGHDPQRGHRGHGLGLTFTRLAVEAHGGTVTLADDGELPGACFVFTLPIAE